MGTFWHKEFSAPWSFRHGIFQHLNISAHGYFSTLQSNMDVLAQTFRHLCHCAETFMVPKNLVPKSPRAEKSLYPNFHRGEMSMCQNNYRTKTCTCRNVLVMKCLCRNVSGQNVRCRNGGKPIAPSRYLIYLLTISSSFRFRRDIGPSLQIGQVSKFW